MTELIIPKDFIKPKRFVNKVYLHCSASNNPDWDDVEKIREYHIEERGFSDCGYHYYMPTSGIIQIGRDIERTPAGQRGHNTGSIAISAHGLYVQDFTKAQLQITKEFCAAINAAYDGNVTFHGHTEVANKLCPVYDYKRLLDLDENGNMGIGGDMPSSKFNHFPLTKQGDSGDVVFILQRLLDMTNADGQFGPATLKAVCEYQEEIGLTADGVAGASTWAELI